MPYTMLQCTVRSDQAAREMIMRPTSTYPEALAFAPETAGADAERRTLLDLARAVLLHDRRPFSRPRLEV